MLKRTRLGLRTRSISENPQAAESVGISVVRIRYISFLISGLLCGLGGAYMSMAYVSFFSRGMVAGRGWIGASCWGYVADWFGTRSIYFGAMLVQLLAIVAYFAIKKKHGHFMDKKD